MSTVSPRLTLVATMQCQAVTPVSISPAACAHSSVAGLGTSDWAGATSSAAYAPDTRKAMTSSPTRTGPAGPTAAGPACATTPAASEPIRIGSAAGSRPNAPEYTL